jgi:hypothetical protein
VFATGRINDPVLAEKVLADGRADMIGMVRSQLCDPNMANKAREGRLDELRYCIADNQGCYGRVGLNRPIGSDVGFVGDLQAVLPKLIDRMKRYRDEGHL